MWKAADQQEPPKSDITDVGCDVKGGIALTCVETGLAIPQSLIVVINCGCSSKGKDVALRVVTTTQIMGNAQSHHQMDVATNRQGGLMHTKREMNKQCTSLSSSFFGESGVSSQ